GSIYYYDKSADSAAVYGDRHREGFNIDSTFEIFGRPASLGVQVLPEGIIAGGKLTDPLDLGFAQLSDETYQGSPRITVKVLTTEKSFGLTFGFTFLQDRFAKGSMSVGKLDDGEAELRATLVYDGSEATFNGSRLSFTYSRSRGFQVSQWPFNLDAVLDFQQYMDGFSTGGCSGPVRGGFCKAGPRRVSLDLSLSVSGAVLA